jgi:hypothetical protein
MRISHPLFVFVEATKVAPIGSGRPSRHEAKLLRTGLLSSGSEA